jgi:hypothetical protein
MKKNTNKIKYWSFKKARKHVHQLGLKNTQEWRKYSQSDKKPKEIPAIAENYYETQWQGMGDWLGNGNIADSTKSKKWLPWKEAKLLYRKIKEENNLKNLKEWEQYVKNNRLPKNLPPFPNLVYSEKNIKNQNQNITKYKSYKDARKFIHSLKLKNRQAWRDYYNSGKLPSDIPSNPHNTYKEWIGIRDWLGTEND